MSKLRSFQTAKRAVCLCLAIELLFVAVLYFVPSWIFYNPRSEKNAPVQVFAALTQILSPDTTCCTFSLNQGFGFSYYSARITCAPAEEFGQRDFSNYGKFGFLFGKAYIQEFYGSVKNYPQSTFLEPQPEQNFDASANRPYNEHLVWVQFASPLNTEKFEQKYAYLFSNIDSRSKGNSFIWIPVKTSDDAMAPCLGVIGNSAVHNLLLRNLEDEPLDNQTLPEREAFFRREIRFLNEHKKETNMFLKSKFWSRGMNVNDMDFTAVEKYLDENGCNYLGFVAFLTASELVKIKEEPNSTVFKIISRT